MTDSSAGSSMATAPTELDHSQDSKADLLRRLGKLTARLQGTTRPHENLVNELRKKVDCMEVLLDCSSTDEESENGPDESSQDEGRPAAIQAQRGSTQVTTSPAVTAEDAPARQPSKLDETSHAKDGRALLLRLSSVVEQLQMRHIELKRIHDLTMQKAKLAAQRILLLETTVEDLQADLSANTSELSYLRVEIQVLEIQAAPFIADSPTADKALTAGLKRWRKEMKETVKREAARREAREAQLRGLDSEGRCIPQ